VDTAKVTPVQPTIEPERYRTPVRAAVLRDTSAPVAVETVRLRDVGPDELRVRIDATGVCHSDLSLARGRLAQPTPAVLGHEACGTVLETGAGVDSVRPGDRVLLLWISPCGNCFFCLQGEPHLCEHGADRSGEPYAIDQHDQPVYPGLGIGSFAEQTVLRSNAVVPVPPDIPAADAALLGCAVTTGVGAVTKVARVRAGSSVLVLGLGGVGLCTVIGARLAGARQILAVDRNPARAALAVRLGADEFLPADDGLRRAVRTLTGPPGAWPGAAARCVWWASAARTSWCSSARWNCSTSPARWSAASGDRSTPVRICRGISSGSGTARWRCPRWPPAPPASTTSSGASPIWSRAARYAPCCCRTAH